jgi:hypothetical protein
VELALALAARTAGVVAVWGEAIAPKLVQAGGIVRKRLHELHQRVVGV